MNNNSKIILISGCSGFLGTELTNQLLTNEHLVIGLDKKNNKKNYHKNFFFKKLISLVKFKLKKI